MKLKKVFFSKKFCIAFFVFNAFLFLLSSFLYEYRKITSEPVSSWTQDSRADCAVVLTGGQGRLREGFDLLERGQVQKLIISGVNQNSDLRDIMPMWNFYPNLREEDIVLDKVPTTTYGNAVQTKIITEALKCRDLVLVTSQLHMSRSYRTFRGQFPEDFTILKHATTNSRWESETEALFAEIFKSFFYFLFAY